MMTHDCDSSAVLCCSAKPADYGWEDLTTTFQPAPPNRQFAAYARAPDAGSPVVMYGGTRGGDDVLEDVWLCDLAGSWTEVTPAQSGPGPRSSAQMIWSVPDSGFLVFGGIRNRAMSATDLWLLQDSGAGWQWSSIAPTGPVPPVMIDHRAVAAKQNGQHVMVIYGGYPSSGNQLHTLDLATRVWVREADVQGDPRQMPTMVWIEELDKVLVFGGRGYQWNNDLRTYSPSDGQWTELSPTGAPPSGRFGSVAVWTGDQMIVHGGFDNYVGPLGRTWHWVNGLDGGNGTWLYNDKPTQPQEAQNSNGAVWDPTLKQMFILEMETGAPKVWAYGIM